MKNSYFIIFKVYAYLPVVKQYRLWSFKSEDTKLVRPRINVFIENYSLKWKDGKLSKMGYFDFQHSILISFISTKFVLICHTLLSLPSACGMRGASKSQD